jgi:general secretion pathway protein K
MRAPGGRRGFALVSVLWVIVGVSALALTANLAAREAVAAARNRADLTEATWLAEDCHARVRAAADAALAEELRAVRDLTAWRRLDRIVAESPLLAGAPCTVEMIPAGARLDVNAVSDETVLRLLLALGVAPSRADSMVDALADWRDPDDESRPHGAERAWYVANGLRPPRNGPLAHVRELRRVRGWDGVPGLDEYLDVEPGRVAVNHAPLPVLAALPGFTPEAVDRVAELRMRGVEITELGGFAGSLSPSARDAFLRQYAELAAVAVTEPDAWIVRSTGAVGTPAAVAVLETRLVRAGARAAVVRRRTWTE